MYKAANMHTVDRFMRLVIGLICIYVGFIDTRFITNELVSALIGCFGIVNLWAFATSRCPVYAMTGFSTASKTETPIEQ